MFEWLNTGTPFFWCFLAMLFIAAAVARASRRRLGAHRWTLVYFYLSVSIGLSLAGVFVPGPQNFLNIRLAYFSAITGFVGFFALRYKVAVGAPLVLLTAMLLTLFGISLRGWLPLRGPSASLARIHVFDVRDSRVDLEVTEVGGRQAESSITGTLPNGPLAPIVEILRFRDYYFFVSSPVFYRLEGVTTSGKVSPSEQLPATGKGGSKPLLIEQLPGVAYSTLLGAAAEPVALQDYAVELRGGLKARIVATQS